MDETKTSELRKAFEDLINYEANDPLEPIDPISYRTPDGDSCLHIAAMRGDLHSVELLLDAGMNINLVGDMGCTPLHYARMGNNEKLIQLLLARGADPDVINEFGEKAFVSNN